MFMMAARKARLQQTKDDLLKKLDESVHVIRKELTEKLDSLATSPPAPSGPSNNPGIYFMV